MVALPKVRIVLLALIVALFPMRAAVAGFAGAISELTLGVKYIGPAGMVSFGPTPSEGIAGPGAGAINGFGNWSADQGGEITKTADSWKLQLFSNAFASSPPNSRAEARRKAQQGVILSVFVDPDEFDVPQVFSLEFEAEFVASAFAMPGIARATGDFSINAFYESSGNGLQFFPSVPLEATAPPSEIFIYNLFVQTFPLVLDPGFRFTVTLRKAEVGAFAAVPEPQTWAMMIAGFGLVGMSLRRRRHYLGQSEDLSCG